MPTSPIHFVAASVLALGLAAPMALADRPYADFGSALRVTPVEGAVQAADLPDDARPGECFVRVLAPPQYAIRTETVLLAEASERVEIMPAQHETVTEHVLVRPASERLVEVPARYGWQDEQVLVQPASTEWRASACDTPGAVPNATGECLCLVEIPASYQTVHRKVVIEPVRTERVAVPAEYKTIQKTVVASPAREIRIPVPAEYTTVTRREKISDGGMSWVRVGCDQGSQLGFEQTRDLQLALRAAGYDPGPVDGFFGPATRQALGRYQRDHGLTPGGCDLATLQSLRIR
jgi:hypothetical protein